MVKGNQTNNEPIWQIFLDNKLVTTCVEWNKLSQPVSLSQPAACQRTPTALLQRHGVPGGLRHGGDHVLVLPELVPEIGLSRVLQTNLKGSRAALQSKFGKNMEELCLAGPRGPCHPFYPIPSFD